MSHHNDIIVSSVLLILLANVFLSGSSFGTQKLEKDFLNLNLNEKEILNGINSRFVTYIEKGIALSCFWNKQNFVEIYFSNGIILLNNFKL